jgi:hypothetical protein
VDASDCCMPSVRPAGPLTEWSLSILDVLGVLRRTSRRGMLLVKQRKQRSCTPRRLKPEGMVRQTDPDAR